MSRVVFVFLSFLIVQFFLYLSTTRVDASCCFILKNIDWSPILEKIKNLIKYYRCNSFEHYPDIHNRRTALFILRPVWPTLDYDYTLCLHGKLWQFVLSFFFFILSFLFCECVILINVALNTNRFKAMSKGNNIGIENIGLKIFISYNFFVLFLHNGIRYIIF